MNIELCQTKYYSFIVNRANNGQTITIFDGKWKNCVTDNPSDGVYVYSVIPYFDDGKNKYFGEEILLPAVNLNKNGSDPQIKIPDIAQKDWYNQ